mgnify:CR=1 FL=1
MDGKFKCNRCKKLLTTDEYIDNICLCDECWYETNGEFEDDDMVWNGFNNVDLILEMKRKKFTIGMEE